MIKIIFPDRKEYDFGPQIRVCLDNVRLALSGVWSCGLLRSDGATRWCIKEAVGRVRCLGPGCAPTPLCRAHVVAPSTKCSEAPVPTKWPSFYFRVDVSFLKPFL